MTELTFAEIVEKMNKTGVRYKPGTMAEEEENLYGQNSESRYENKYPQKKFSMMTNTHLMAEMTVGIMIWILKKGIRSNSVLVT